jgi:hypothetical protein
MKKCFTFPQKGVKSYPYQDAKGEKRMSQYEADCILDLAFATYGDEVTEAQIEFVAENYYRPEGPQA